MHTWAAHNEYLRIGVEGGMCGSALLVGLFAGWVFVHTRPLCPSDRRIMRLVFVAYAGLATTDNVLISTPACVMFAFATAVFARGERDAHWGQPWGRPWGQPRIALPGSRLVA
jgi:O-antigen ligase